MAFDVKLSITGIQEAQAQNLRRVAALRPTGAFGAAIRDATAEAHRYAVALTHVDTGALRASHRVQVTGVRGRVFVDPGALNPRSGRRTAEYGVYEHRRGGGHAFYERVVSEHGAEILRRARLDVKLGVEGA